MKNFETGHTTNVTNFQTLISTCSSFGNSYIPQRSDLTIANLIIQHSANLAGMSNVNTRFSAWKIAVATRELTFKRLNEICTRILAALQSSNVRLADIENVLTILRKLSGQRATPKHPMLPVDLTATTTTEPGAPANGNHKNISVSQMSFNSRVANMDILIKLLLPLSGYNPNEADLSVSSLKTLYNLMASQNNEVVINEINLANARIARNVLLYNPQTGLVATALAVKSYIRSVFTASSPQYKKVSGISFKTMAKI